jgi:hypothetical protein
MREARLSKAQWNFLSAHLARRVAQWIWRGLIPREDRYCPEKYYMRGPGPKWREKQLATRRQGGL